MAIKLTPNDVAAAAEPPSKKPISLSGVSYVRGFLRRLGPGLITGASDDDPSGIATYAQIGAQFGFAMLWTLLFSYPLMVGIQEVAAWLGRVTGIGIAGNMRRHYSAWLVYPIIAVLLIANVINLGADIGAMGQAFTLLFGGPAILYSVLCAIICVTATVSLSYARFARLLKWAALVLLVYVATAFVVPLPWRLVLSGSFIPSVSLSGGYMTALMAIFGTTISPYLFFWQASLEVQEQKVSPGERPLKRAPEQASFQLQPMRADTRLGMAISNIVAFFIMLDTASALHARGVTDIQTAGQAAAALRPLAGELAFFLFSIGIIGTGLLAVPVLAGSVAYAVAETLKWPIGLDRRIDKAKGFYAVFIIATVLGLVLNFTSINPIRALFWSAVINGVCAAPIMIVMMVMATDPKVTGAVTLAAPQRVLGWLSTVVMLAVSIGMIVSLI